MNAPQTDTPMFPIMGGPSVPWEVMLPHENQAQKNHGQTLRRLAERGGLGPHEAWAVVNGLSFFKHSKGEVESWENKWREFAAQTNRRYERLERELSEAKKQIENLIPGFFAGNEALEKLSALQAHYLALEEKYDTLKDIADRMAEQLQSFIDLHPCQSTNGDNEVLSEFYALKGEK